MTHTTPTQALRLKELGFDKPIRDNYREKQVVISAAARDWNDLPWALSAPTHAEALQWFREKKGLHGWVEPFVTHLFNRWTYCITIKNVGLTALGSAIYPTHPEAESALIDKLITILEKQKT